MSYQIHGHCHDQHCNLKHENERCHHKHSQYAECKDNEGPDQFLSLADKAWMEVLKEKIKEQIMSSKGKELDELAKIIAEANGSRWKHKIEFEKCCKEYHKNLSKFLDRSCG